MQGVHPLNLDVDSPVRVARWRPLVNWVLVLPHSVWLELLALGSMVVTVAGWFAIVATGRMPDSWGDYNVAVLRYQWRINAFLYGWTDAYPSFAPPAGYVDPGDFPAVLYCARPVQRNRWTVLARALLLIPHAAVVLCAGVATAMILLASWFAVLITGRWPDPVRRFAIGFFRYSSRVAGYAALVTDEYPTFGFDP